MTTPTLKDAHKVRMEVVDSFPPLPLPHSRVCLLFNIEVRAPCVPMSTWSLEDNSVEFSSLSLPLHLSQALGEHPACFMFEEFYIYRKVCEEGTESFHFSRSVLRGFS